MSSTVIPHCFKNFTPVRFAEGQNNIFQNELLSGIGAKYGKTVAQVILRWHIQPGVVTIPKSVRKERIAENFDVWDFTLSEEDIAAITAMDSGKSEIIDHFTAGTAKALNGWKIHR
ncbi:aldo/keto reductase [Priestia megaterium]|jgi:2,5-diketo-D-gluconate reductase A|uniref:aldo/keto reductase n=1 Tax=Priestia megaterium TaxID=1404 RepID=UPI001C237D6A|nr:aldo/keto reductase [Priestia megaterium]MBU8753490.1 aldo/keto reductase [Priestia megaterium]